MEYRTNEKERKKMIKLNKTENGARFPKSIFESVAMGRAFELLRHDSMQHLAEIQKELHFKYCRFHGLFHDEMEVVRRAEDGSLAYQWHHVDKLCDNLLSVGLKPFLELNSMPEALASGDTTACWWKMNTSEPKDYNEWGDLIENFVRHLVQRYGLDEVGAWYFEVWNEPNINGFWPAGMEKYYDLYKYTAEAVKRVDKSLKIGGPATAGGDYIAELIEYCDKNDVALDFVTTHAYPIGEYCEYKERENSPYELGEYFVGRFREVYDTVKNSSMPDLEIHWTEWNTQSGNTSKNISWTCNPTVDNQFGGACVVRNMLGVKDICDSASYWVATDIFEEPSLSHSVFSCTYGLVNIHGIRKATYNAYKLLRKMSGRKLDTEAKLPLGCGAESYGEAGVVKILAYNQRLLEIENQPDWNEKISIPVDCDGEYIITSAKLEKDHGSCYETWLDMGAPQNLTPMQEERLRAASVMNYNHQLVTSENGRIEVEFSLKADEVIYLEVQKQDIKAMPRKAFVEEGKKMDAWNEALMLPEKKTK